MDTLADEHEERRNVPIRKVALASGIGSAVEWYDFFLYGTTAVLVFNSVFFPTFSPLAGTLAALGTFAAGFVSRPLGGIVCGHFGDRIGRKTMLVLTLMMMGIATFLIGLLPTYAAIGVWAPILLVTLRLLQGFGMGGELGGAQLMCVEYSPAHRRGFFGSWPMSGSPVGMVMSTGLLAIMAFALSEEQFLAWGWRVPFLFSILLVVVGLFIRLRLMDSPAFRQIQETNTQAAIPILDVLRTYPRKILLAVCMYLGVTVSFYASTVFATSYMTSELGLGRFTALAIIAVAMLAFFPMILGFGALSDVVGRRIVYCGGGLLMALTAFPFFFLLDTQILPLMTLGIILLGTADAAMAGTQGAYFAELFGTRVRYSGVSLGLTVATLIGGAVTPSLATVLIAWSGGSWPVALYLIAVGLVAALGAYYAGETSHIDIYETYAEERDLLAEQAEPITISPVTKEQSAE